MRGLLAVIRTDRSGEWQSAMWAGDSSFLAHAVFLHTQRYAFVKAFVARCVTVYGHLGRGRRLMSLINTNPRPLWEECVGASLLFVSNMWPMSPWMPQHTQGKAIRCAKPRKEIYIHFQNMTFWIIKCHNFSVLHCRKTPSLQNIRCSCTEVLWQYHSLLYRSKLNISNEFLLHSRTSRVF